MELKESSELKESEELDHKLSEEASKFDRFPDGNVSSTSEGDKDVFSSNDWRSSSFSLSESESSLRECSLRVSALRSKTAIKRFLVNRQNRNSFSTSTSCVFVAVCFAVGLEV